ncbi:hypothetical protein ACSJL3_005206 (plasmid) [Serratia nevei]
MHVSVTRGSLDVKHGT